MNKQSMTEYQQQVASCADTRSIVAARAHRDDAHEGMYCNQGYDQVAYERYAELFDFWSAVVAYKQGVAL